MSEINTSGLKARVIEAVNEHAKLAQVINDSLFSFGELGFHEYETSKYLTAMGVVARAKVVAATVEKPPIDLNQTSMDKFRPLMQPFYYDARRYDTYLEQLGIVYPTLERPS